MWWTVVPDFLFLLLFILLYQIFRISFISWNISIGIEIAVFNHPAIKQKQINYLIEIYKISLHPFIITEMLTTEDLQRFLEIRLLTQKSNLSWHSYSWKVIHLLESVILAFIHDFFPSVMYSGAL